MKSNKTREKILDASLKLFNEKKSSNVSTVQISAHMNISPGNLYYYFANKEEVVRCLWNERMAGEIGEIFAEVGQLRTVDQLLEFLDRCFIHYTKYRFFYTELPTLFVNDRELVEVYKKVADRNIKAFSELFEHWIKTGDMRQMSESERMMLADNCWILSQVTVANYDFANTGQFDFEFFSGVASMHILALMNPYFSEEMRSKVADELTARGLSEKDYGELKKKFS
ncbi:MAG: TetR/AcrR family transcriptional regulator [Bacillota bacterium]|nr:TetR/AcrR family transcriptional regulator [Bacillota bacterium]